MSVTAPALNARRYNSLDNPGMMAGVRGLAVWSMAHIWYALIVALLPPNTGLIYQMYKFLGLSLVACLIVTFSKLKVPLRIVWPVGLLMVLQIWFVFCDMQASLTLGRFSPFGTPDFLLLFYVFYFIQAAALVYYAPETRKLLIKMLIWSTALSSFVALLQFIKVGPALQLGNLYNAARNLENWDNRGGVRAFGLTGWPAMMALTSLGAAALIASRMLDRKLKVWELLACIAFLGVSLTAQARTLYPGIALAALALLWMLAKRDKPKALAFVMLAAALVTVLVTLFYDRIAYALTTNIFNDPNLNFRMHVAFPQAYKIFEARPWTGIGPDLNLVFISPATIPDRWVTGQTLDNGYLMLLAWGGLPALAIFLSAIGSGIAGLAKIVKMKGIDPSRRQLAFYGAAMLLGLLDYMLGGVGFVDTPFISMLLMTAIGLSLPSRDEAKIEVKRPLQV